jgi:hypothetical protein
MEKEGLERLSIMLYLTSFYPAIRDGNAPILK